MGSRAGKEQSLTAKNSGYRAAHPPQCQRLLSLNGNKAIQPDLSLESYTKGSLMKPDGRVRLMTCLSCVAGQDVRSLLEKCFLKFIRSVLSQRFYDSPAPHHYQMPAMETEICFSAYHRLNNHANSKKQKTQFKLI